MGRLTKDYRCLIMGLRTEKNWGAKRLIKEFPNKQSSVSSVILVCYQKSTTAGQLKGNRAVAVRGLPGHRY